MNKFFEIVETPLADLKLIQRTPLADSRGYFERMFCTTELAQVAPNREVVQINHTLTKYAGTVRGMHFQWPPHAEVKFINCIRGRVYDVAVDLRRDSPTLFSWYAHILSPESNNMMLIPEGFAHGFQALSDECEMLYFHTASYCPKAEGGLNACDPQLGIKWPLNITEMSSRDRDQSMLTDDFEGIEL